MIRTWAFCDGQEWNALQPQPGTSYVSLLMQASLFPGGHSQKAGVSVQESLMSGCSRVLTGSWQRLHDDACEYSLP